MPGFDNYGQNVQYPKLSDQPNAETGFGTLTNGVVARSNMIFANANARAAALATPVDGMETYLVAEQRKEIRVNGAWQVAVLSALPWANVALPSAYQAWVGNTVGPRVRREGSIVYLEGRMMRKDGANIPASDALVIGTVPLSYAPVGHYAEGFATLTNAGTGAPLARIEVWPNSSDPPGSSGQIKMYSDKATSLVGFSSWWFVN